MPDLMDTYMENRQSVQPHHANALGTAHGGNVMKWMDTYGALSAMRFAGETVVTARMDQVNFRRPIAVGNTAVVTSYVYAAGTTSVRVRLATEAEDARSGEAEQTTSSYAVYVAVDDDREPTAVPELTTGSARGERLRREALEGENDPGR